MYVKRLLHGALNSALRHFPAVLITGPRQAGKTTFLLHETRKGTQYVTFDDPMERHFALADPNGFLDRFGDAPVILDEIQYVPELFPHLKIRIDRERHRNGRWLLTGSQQFQLMKNITESLAGRIALLELLPFSLLELRRKGGKGLESCIWHGGYPEPALHHNKRNLWLRGYIQTYLERDVRQIQNIKDLRQFEVFTGLVASNHGQAFNTAALSRRIGVSLPTIKAWASVLEASYILYMLQPYYRNYGKRLIKTPKLYFLDPALVCDLTKQPDVRSALAGAMAGALFEGMVMSEVYKAFAMKGRRPEMYCWRSHDGLEVDLIVRIRGKVHPVEIKLTSTPTPWHLEPLNKFKKLAGADAAGKGILVCRIQKQTPLPSNNTAVPWSEFPEWLFSEL